MKKLFYDLDPIGFRVMFMSECRRIKYATFRNYQNEQIFITNPHPSPLPSGSWTYKYAKLFCKKAVRRWIILTKLK